MPGSRLVVVGAHQLCVLFHELANFIAVGCTMLLHEKQEDSFCLLRALALECGLAFLLVKVDEDPAVQLLLYQFSI